MARTPKTVEFDKDVSDQIVALRNDGKKWSEIGDAVQLAPGKCMLIFDVATVRPKDRIKSATGADIVRLRDEESISWAAIVARTGYPESSCRSMYEETSGRSTKGNRIGKGGRHPGDGSMGTSPAKAKGATKKAAAKAPVVSPLDGLSAEDVKTKLTGFAIKVQGEDGAPEVIKVKSVKSVSAKAIVLTDAGGQGRTIKRAAIVQVSSKKVIKD